MGFDISRKLSPKEIICLKYQSLFSEKKNIEIYLQFVVCDPAQRVRKVRKGCSYLHTMTDLVNSKVPSKNGADDSLKFFIYIFKESKTRKVKLLLGLFSLKINP